MRGMWMLLACALSVALAAGCAQKKVLLVTSYADGSPRVAEMESAIKKEFRREGIPVTFHVFNMNTQSRPNEVWRDEMGKMAVTRANALEPDVVLVAGDDAAHYCAQRMAGMSKDFVFFDMKAEPATYKLVNSPHVTGVQEALPVKESFNLMKQIVPSARGAAVLADYSLEGDAVVARINAAGLLPIRVVEVRRARNVGEWMAAVRDLQTKADVICIGSYSAVLAAGTTGAAVPAAELLKMTAQVNRRPDFSFDPEAVGPAGVLASVYVPVAQQAAVAARMAIDHLYYAHKIASAQIKCCDDYRIRTNADRAAQLGVKLPEVPSFEAPAAPPPAPPLK